MPWSRCSSTRAAAMAMVPVVAWIAIGCGTKTVDPSEVAANISAKILEQQPTVAPVSVSCPSDVRVQSGASFQCTFTGAAGLTGAVDVTMTDDAGTLSIRYPAPPGTGPPGTRTFSAFGGPGDTEPTPDASAPETVASTPDDGGGPSGGPVGPSGGFSSGNDSSGGGSGSGSGGDTSQGGGHLGPG